MYFNDCELIIVIKIAAMIKVCFFFKLTRLIFYDEYGNLKRIVTDCNLFKNDVKLYSL